MLIHSKRIIAKTNKLINDCLVFWLVSDLSCKIVFLNKVSTNVSLGLNTISSRKGRYQSRPNSRQHNLRQSNLRQSRRHRMSYPSDDDVQNLGANCRI